MRLRLRKLLERVRRRPAMRWPWQLPNAEERVAFLPPKRADFTVHRDIALRLRNLSIDLRTPLADPGPESGAFKIRVASSPKARREASSLVRKRYSGRGYLTSTTLVNAHSCTFSAYDEGRLSGTLTLRLDSEDGLAAEDLYGDATRVLREQGHKICEFHAPRRGHGSHLVSSAGRALSHSLPVRAEAPRVRLRCDRGQSEARRLLPARAWIRSDRRRHNTRVNAPAVLMGVSFDAIALKLQRHAGKGTRAAAVRNLFEHGFSAAEAEGILGRLRTLDTG